MRFIIPAFAGVLAVGLAAPTASFAAAKKQTLQQSFDSCVALAKERGYTAADRTDVTGSGDTAVRRFVINCMQGGQKRARQR
jgi:hypothetical protein